ncbi:MAG: hypothetical protein WBE68_26490, partial [Candidatus Nitrosopolaris sp.]
NVTVRNGGPLSHLLGKDNTNHTSTDEEEVIPWQAVSTTNTNSISNVITPRDAGPLSHLLGEDTSTDEEEVIPPVTSYSNLPSSVPPTVSMSLYPNTNIPSNFNPYFNPYQNNINPQISKPETQESPQLKPQPQHQQYHDVNNGSNYDDQEVLDPELKKEFDDSWQKNLFQKIIEGRKEHQQQIQLIERRQQELDEQKRQIENIRQDLEARENKLRSVEDLIPSSKHLKDIGIRFDQALVWVDCIKEVAQKEQIDERTAAWKLADMLRSFKTLGGLEKAIAVANQQLVLLNTANDQQRKAISTLVNLQSAGFGEKDIAELTGLVNTWNARSGIWNQASLSHNNGNNGGQKLDTELIGVGH